MGSFLLQNKSPQFYGTQNVQKSCMFFFPAKIAGESYGVRAFCCKIWRSAQESSSGSVSSHPASVY